MAGNISKYIVSVLFKTPGAKKFKTTNQNITKQLDKYGKLSSKTIKTTQKLGNITKTTSARFDKHGKVLGKSVKYQKDSNKAMQKGASMGAQLTKALKRAAVVAPIWMLLRSVMMGVISTIKEGFKYWMDFDAQLRKSEQVVHDFKGTLEEAADILTKKMKILSQETGESMTDLTKAFYRFGTVGIDFEKSMEGAEIATKLATVMFGNADKLAKVLAQAYRLLGNTIDQTIPKEKQLLSVGAQIYKLWQDNAFEINEMSGALERFLPTANTMNFTLEETIALLASLHTAGVKGTRTGRLLSSSFQRFLSNIDEVANSLGVYVNPQLDSTHDVLERVMKTMHKFSMTGGDLPIEALRKMSDIFGGVRQKRVILALDTMYETWLDNQEAIDTTGGKWQELIKDFESGFDRVINSVSRQKKITEELKNQLAMAFVKGVFGGEDFEETLKNINVWLKENIDTAETFGRSIGNITTAIGHLAETIGGFGVFKIYGEYWRAQEKAAKKTMAIHDKLLKARKGEFETSKLDKYIKKLESAIKVDYSTITPNVEEMTPEQKEAYEIQISLGGVENVKRTIDELKKRMETGTYLTIGEEKISNKLTDLIDAMKTRKTELGKILADAMGDKEARDMAKELEKISQEEGGVKKTAGALGTILNKLKEGQKSSKGQVQEQLSIKKAIETIEPVQQNLLDILKQQTKEQEKQAELSFHMDIAEKLSNLKKEKELIIEQYQGMTEVEAIHKKLTDSISKEVKKYNTMVDTQRASLQQEQLKLEKKKESIDLSEKEQNRVKEISKELKHIPKHLDKTKAMSLAINGNYKRLAELTQYQNINEEKFVEWQKLSNEELKETIKLREQQKQLLATHVGDMLQMQGASTIEQIKSKIALEEKLGLNQDVLSVLDKELELQRAITQEELDRNKATSETVKLWKIARAFGKGTANTIASALESGNLSALTGQTRKVAAHYFKGPMEQDLASDYWGTGDVTGDMRAAAADKPEQIMAQTLQNLPNQLTTSMQKALQFMPSIQPQFEVINNIQIDGNELGQAVVKKVDTEIRNKNSETNKAIKQSIQDGLNKGEIQ